ncbi:MAG: hypothetical protein QOH57_4876, partial [Mycobacterium sp.]|nr:hypothetical protein [Mycobacterium sp.]
QALSHLDQQVDEGAKRGDGRRDRGEKA